MDWLLQKAIESSGKTYDPSQVAEMLDNHAVAINQNAQSLDAKINMLIWALLALIIIFQAANLFCGLRLNKRMKKLEI